VDTLTQINLPTVLNAFGTINSDDQVTVTGLAVNPVADLGSFGNVNGAYIPNFGGGAPGTPGVTGEILYVSYYDSESGLRLLANNTLVRSGVLAFPVSDAISPALAAPGNVTGVGFPVTVGGAFGVAFSVFANEAGVAVDDDGSVYFQQVDLIQFTGGNIVKIASQDDVAWQDRSLATSGFDTLSTLNPTNGLYPSASGPVGGGVSQISRFTNYSGTSTLFGDIMALASAPSGNALFAAVSRSFVASDDGFTQLTEGLFPAPSAFTAGTPSMVISFADCSGAFDICSGSATGALSTQIQGTIPAADGFADAAVAGQAVTPGVNNYRIFVLGNGPDIRPPAGGTAVVPGTPATVLKIDMQVDFTIHNGLAVDEEGKVYVVSGGTPAGIGKNPSPMLGEILLFEDMCPMDRRADFVDLRADVLPNPPTDANVGDGDSDRFDHIFWQSPLDQVTLTPAGIAGLARGFLRYTNRLAPAPIGGTTVAPLANTVVTLGQTGGQQVLGDDASAGIIGFEFLDPSHQVAGGDDQNPPFTGDDDDGAGTPPLTGTLPNPPFPTTALQGGFEFVFGGPVGTAACVWNGFYWNSNGSITFGGGDTDNTATVPEFRSNRPKIAPAWTDLNPNARAASLRNFPVMALGFANINAFKIRDINVPRFGEEGCSGTASAGGALLASGLSNTFAVTLYDDGTGIDENANQPLNPANPIGNNAVAFDLQEGPTALRFTREPNTGTIVGCPPRRDGTGQFIFEYGRMDLLGTGDFPVIAGYSIGGLAGTNPPGICETNLSEAARGAETTFGVLVGSQTAGISCNCLIGEGTEPTIFELFTDGKQAGIGSGGEQTFATPDFDLRFEGNDAASCTSTRQRDLNRGKVAFFGIGCAPPPNPNCLAVVPSPFAVTPTTTGLVNALCAVQLNLIGCGFFPNEVTTVCQGFFNETGIPLQRPGKTVSTAATLACDTNGDGIPESVVVLTAVTPVSCNLVRATIPVSATFGANSTSGFPSACCGGPATIALTTTFTAGDNNVFGPFTRTAICSLNLGVRAPVVISASPSSGNCSIGQDLLITGACFSFTTPGANGAIVGTVTSVFALDRANTANRINAQTFVIINPNLIDAFFQFGSASAGKTFLIFVQGTGGTSRNLTTLPAGSPAGCALGNEQGVQVSFTCSSSATPVAPAVLTSYTAERAVDGSITLIVKGTNIRNNALVAVGNTVPKKVKTKGLETGSSDSFNTLILRKGFCSELTGHAAIVVTNPGAAASNSLFVTESCQ
jgi:hypothetical protein